MRVLQSTERSLSAGALDSELHLRFQLSCLLKKNEITTPYKLGDIKNGAVTYTRRLQTKENPDQTTSGR